MYDIIVIGAGAAGMTAALYALRSGKSVLVLESESFGGQVAVSPRIENFPTHKAVSGADFADKLLEQIIELGAQVELEKAESVKKVAERHFEVKTDYGTHEASSVILATGVKHRNIGVAREAELTGRGVSYCAVCDGAFFSGQDVALIGDANTALQYSILLSNYCRKVYVLTLFDRFFGEKSLVDTLISRQNVEIRHNLSLLEFTGKNELEGLILKDTETNEIVNYNVKGCFICIGQVPNNKAFESLAVLDAKGYIIAGEDCRTTTEGVFAAGDCRTKTVRQITTATADGAVAAIAACQYIDKLIRPVI